MMRIAVTGKSGQLARCLGESKPSDMAVTFLGRAEMDLSEKGFDLSPLAAVAPDLVINAAAYTAVDKAEEEQEAAFQLNAQAPAQIAAFCVEHGIPLVHISTDYVFDGMSGTPYTENHATGPVNVYAQSKLDGEVIVSSLMDKYIILRASWIYSAFGHNFVKTMLRLAEDRDRLTIVHDQRGVPTSAHDLARTIWQLARRIGAGEDIAWGLYHYSASGNASWAEFAEEIFAQASGVLQNVPEVVRVPTSQYPTPAERPQFTVLDCGKFDAAFGIQRPEWSDSLRVVISKLYEEVS